MKIKFDNFIDIKNKEIAIVFIPTIILDKTQYSTNIYIGWLCFEVTITF